MEKIRIDASGAVSAADGAVLAGRLAGFALVGRQIAVEGSRALRQTARISCVVKEGGDAGSAGCKRGTRFAGGNTGQTSET